MSPLFATSDPHGHLTELTAALQEAGLLDEGSHWCGGDSRLWVLGDLLDTLTERLAYACAWTAPHPYRVIIAG